MSRAYTEEEVRDMFLNHVRALAEYWGNQKCESEKDRCEGMAFSMLNIFDGTTVLPAFNIAVSPHPDDKQYNIDNGDNWIEPGMVINDCMLHELFYQKD